MKDVIPHNGACLCGCINWSLVKAQQQASIGLCQSFPSVRGGKARPQTGFLFTVQKRPLPESSIASFARRPYLESRTEACPGGKKSVGGSVSSSSADARKKGAWGLAILMCHSPQPPHHPHLWFAVPFFGSMEKHYFLQICG